MLLDGKTVPMQKDGEGVWSATLGPLDPNYYTYSLVVDGTSISDPANRQIQTSFGSFQSMFVIAARLRLALRERANSSAAWEASSARAAS